MIGIDGALRRGFVVAHRSFGLMFLDSLWKAVWLAATSAVFAGIGIWIVARLQAVDWQAPNLPGGGAIVMAGLLRDLWTAYSSELFSLIVAAGTFSLLLWIVLEAYARSRLLETSPFRVFLLSGLATRFVMAGAILTAAAIIFGQYLSVPVAEWPALWADSRAAFFVALVAIASLGFLLKVFETAIRSDALELLGTHLFEFAGLIGTLVVFEGLIDASILVLVASAVLLAGSPTQGILAAIFGSIVILILSLLNSYLLIVRFSAVGIMRHDADDV